MMAGQTSAGRLDGRARRGFPDMTTKGVAVTGSLRVSAERRVWREHPA